MIINKTRKFLASNFEFAPLDVPLERRLQMAATIGWGAGIWGSQTIWVFLCSFPPLWPILILYYIHMWTDDGPFNCSRPSKWFRSCAWWMYWAAYFPISIVKEVDLPADRTYVFGYHPHGVISMSAFLTFATEGAGFSKAFPGIFPHLLTLTTQFRLPFWRDVGIYTGVCDVGKRSIKNILTKGPGKSVAIVVGGAAESLYARPGAAQLKLQKRYGFIKIAMQHGSDLVPVFGFGENDLYKQLDNEPGTAVYAFQKKWQSIFGFTLPIIYGRGMFNYSVGLLPHRRRITVVFGRPIHLEKTEKIDEAEVQRVHNVYMEELTRIYNKYKDVYYPHGQKELTFV